MDLNGCLQLYDLPDFALAPSWSHGSKSADQRTIKDHLGWLPRGAMDLNNIPHTWAAGAVTLAPSWSHGSKFHQNPRQKLTEQRWLPRGAMDLNPTSDAL